MTVPAADKNYWEGTKRKTFFVIGLKAERWAYVHLSTITIPVCLILK